MGRRLPVSTEAVPVEFWFDGTVRRAYQGDTVSTAMLAQGQEPLMRSLKYHRPRTSFCMQGHCGSCLVRIDGVPNVRACMTGVAAGMVVESQNVWGSAKSDALGVIDRVFAKGMDHHTLMTQNKLLNRSAQPFVRMMSGQGELPAKASSQPSRAQRLRCDVLVVGGGYAGIAAASAAIEQGAEVIVVDEGMRLGGSHAAMVGALSQQASTLRAHEKLRVYTNTTLIGVYADHDQHGDEHFHALAANDFQTYRVDPKVWVWATGSYPQLAAFENNDRPGVFALRAAIRAYHAGVLVGERVVLATDASQREQAMSFAALLESQQGHCDVVDIDDVVNVKGDSWVTAVELRTENGTQSVDCDALCIATTPSPATEGARMMGCTTSLQPSRGGFALVRDAQGRTSEPRVFACGDVTGFMGPQAAESDGHNVGKYAAQAALEAM